MFTKETNDEFDKFRHFHISERPEEEKELIEHFNYVAKKHPPYLLTLADCEKKNLIGENNTRYNDKKLLEYVQSLILGINDEEMNMDNLTEMTATEKHNKTYHCCKIMYLIDQYRTVGLHSTIQGIIEGQHMFVHPGMSRVHALWFLKARNEKIIMWDTNNTFTDKKPLTYEQWRKVFDIEDKQIFAANVDGKLIEMHMQEERKDIVGSVQKIRDMFDFLRPVLVGSCEPEVRPWVRRVDVHENTPGVIIECKNDYVFTEGDLIQLLQLYPDSVTRIEKENFVIYSK